MKKKLLIGLAALALVALVTVGAWAWFTASDSVTNTFTAGTVSIKVDEVFGSDNDFSNWNPGQCIKKEVKVKNTGTKCARVRVKLIYGWGTLSEDGTEIIAYDPALSADNVTLHFNDDSSWTELQTDGYYYYKSELAKNTETTLLLEQVCLDGASTGNEYQGKEFHVLVFAEAIQCSNGAPNDAWDVDFDDPPWAEENGNGNGGE